MTGPAPCSGLVLLCIFSYDSSQPSVYISCNSKIITCTRVGHKDMQKHPSPCPTYGVVITYILHLDQENVSFKFREPENGNGG